MKEVKKTKVPLPVAKPKQKSQKAPPKPELSQEFVDSDDDSHTESTAQPKKAEKPKATIGIHVNGVAKSKTKSSKTDAPSSKSTSKPKASPKKPAPKQVVTERDVEELSSSEISDDDAPARDIQTKLPGNEASKKVSSDSDSDDTSSSEDSSDESDTDDAPQPKQNPVPSQPQAPAPSHAVDFQPTKAYVPPKGFNPVPLNDKTISRSTDLFANLEGKQIWHITAPAGVSLKDLKQFAMDKATKGEVVLNHKGTDYAFSQTEKSEDGARQVILPQKDGMKPVSAQIAQTLRLRSVVQIPQLSSKQADQNTGSEAAASITQSTIRAPRPQVTGLKMRFLPIGFTGTEGGLLDGSDGEAEPARETAVPEPSKQSKKQKRKHADVNGGDATEAPSKKSKKHLDPEEEAKRKAEKKAKKEKKRAKEASSVAS